VAASGPVTITVLGSGTSSGVPTIGCHCSVCTSPDPRDQRLRPSVSVRFNGRVVLIDTTPDFRQQALRSRLDRVDAILFTHSHADHIMGLDDVRPFNYRQNASIPIYGSEETIAAIKSSFRYIFEARDSQSTIPRLDAFTLNGKGLDLFGLEFQPVPLFHGRGMVYGFRFGDAAYLTDHSEIPEASLQALEALDVLFLDALRDRPHPTHSTVERSIGYVERLKPKRAYFTHICHDLSHELTEQRLPAGVHLAYDGLEIQLGGGD
jgi:phosphoribosyl 1,2-cyclic phosphate phosphodiesterase